MPRLHGLNRYAYLTGMYRPWWHLPRELFLDLEALPARNPPGTATSVLQLVGLSSDTSEILVLNPTSYLGSFPVQAWVLYPKD